VSYCRWSDDDFQCDVYCYQDCSGGFTTHVASNRPILDEILPPRVVFDSEHYEEWLTRDRLVMKWIETAERLPIGLPFDGKTFNDPTAQDTAERLRSLKEVGYNVPDYAIEALLEEVCA